MSVTITDTELFFHYQMEEVFSKISKITMIRAKSITDKEGRSLVDTYGLSEDEKTTLEDFLSAAIQDAFQITQNLSFAISGGLLLDQIIEGDANSYGFKVVNNQAYNANTPQLADHTFRKFINAHILAAWYKQVGLLDEAKVWQMEKIWTEQDLRVNKLLELRRPNFS